MFSNTSITTILIALITSGTLGTIITAIGRSKERKQTESIRAIVNETTEVLRKDIEEVKGRQTDLLRKVDNLGSKTQALETNCKAMCKTMEHSKQVSQTCDYYLLKALRKKGLINGEGEALVELLMKEGSLILAEKVNFDDGGQK